MPTNRTTDPKLNPPARRLARDTDEQIKASPGAQRAEPNAQRAVSDPGAASAGDVLALQKGYGNRAVQRLLASRQVQAKLQVGPAGDPYEQEADRTAQEIVSRKAIGEEDAPGAA